MLSIGYWLLAFKARMALFVWSFQEAFWPQQLFWLAFLGMTTCVAFQRSGRLKIYIGSFLVFTLLVWLFEQLDFHRKLYHPTTGNDAKVRETITQMISFLHGPWIGLSAFYYLARSYKSVRAALSDLFIPKPFLPLKTRRLLGKKSPETFFRPMEQLMGVSLGWLALDMYLVFFYTEEVFEKQVLYALHHTIMLGAIYLGYQYAPRYVLRGLVAEVTTWTLHASIYLNRTDRLTYQKGGLLACLVVALVTLTLAGYWLLRCWNFYLINRDLFLYSGPHRKLFFISGTLFSILLFINLYWSILITSKAVELLIV